MKNPAKLLVIFIIICHTFNAYAFTACYEKKDFMPYISEVNHDGLLLDILKDTFKELPLSITFIRRPWKRCIELLKKNQIDAIFPALWTKKRENWASFPKNTQNYLWDSKYFVFTHINSKIKFENGKFHNLKFGIDAPPGYVAYKKLKSLNVLTKFNNAPKKAFQLLLLKRIDGYVIEENIGKYIASKNNANDKVKMLKEVFHSGKWFMPISKSYFEKNKELSQRIWRTIAKMRKKSTFLVKEN